MFKVTRGGRWSLEEHTHQGLIQDFFAWGGENFFRTTCMLNVRSVLGAYRLYYNFALAILEALKA